MNIEGIGTNPELSSIIEQLSSARFAYKAAVARNAGVSTEKTRLMNLLFNNLDKILEAIKSVDYLSAQCAALNTSLEEADEEYRELNNKYRELSAASTAQKPKKTTKPKAAEE